MIFNIILSLDLIANLVHNLKDIKDYQFSINLMKKNYKSILISLIIVCSLEDLKKYLICFMMIYKLSLNQNLIP